MQGDPSFDILSVCLPPLTRRMALTASPHGRRTLQRMLLDPQGRVRGGIIGKVRWGAVERMARDLTALAADARASALRDTIAMAKGVSWEVEGPREEREGREGREGREEGGHARAKACFAAGKAMNKLGQENPDAGTRDVAALLKEISTTVVHELLKGAFLENRRARGGTENRPMGGPSF